MQRPRRAKRCILEFIRYLCGAPFQETSHDEISADLHAHLLGHLYKALNLTGILTFARIFGGFAIAMTLACVNAHAVPILLAPAEAVIGAVANNAAAVAASASPVTFLVVIIDILRRTSY